MIDRTQLKQQLLSLFETQSCWEILPLAQALDCSIPSVRRLLSEVGYHGSFTHNGRWYTLASIPKFGRDGLWFHGQIGFSRAGSLTGALIDLAGRSPAGLSAEALGAKLRCRPHSILVSLHRQGRLAREKNGRAFVYLSGDQQAGLRQRQRLIAPKPPLGPLPAEIAVLILVEFIRNADSTFADLAEALRKNSGLAVDPSQIERLFADHGLKKTR